MASETPPQNSRPVHWLIPLFPCFQLLDLAGPLDMLNLLSTVPGTGLHSLTLTFVASTMDPVPVKPISPKSGAYKFEEESISSPDTPDGLINRTFNQSIVPDMTFDEYLRILHEDQTTTKTSKKLKPIDVVLIPGGIGTRINRIYPSSSSSAPISNVHDVIQFLREIHPLINHSIITVCTGADILAQTDLLHNRLATTNATRFEHVRAKNPGVQWLKFRRWVKSTPTAADLFQRPIYTSAGILAGMDVLLAFVAEVWGRDLARRAALMLEYRWDESVGDGVVDPFYETEEWKRYLGE